MKIQINHLFAVSAIMAFWGISNASEQTYTHLFVLKSDRDGGQIGVVLENGEFREPSTIVGPYELSDGAIASHTKNLMGLNAAEIGINKDALMQICKIEQRPVSRIEQRHETNTSWWARFKSWLGYPLEERVLPEERYLNDQGLKKRTDMYYVSVMDDQSARQIPHSSQVKWVSLQGIEKNSQVSAETRVFIEILRVFKLSASTDISLPVAQMQESFAARGIKAEITFTVPVPLFEFVLKNNVIAKTAYAEKKNRWDFLEALLVIPAIPLFIAVGFSRFIKG